MTDGQKPRQRGLSRERIVSAGLAIAETDGVDGVTMRRVAASLGVSPMSLYTHVSNKDTLLDLMHCEISARIYDGDPEGSWRAELFALCIRTRRLFLDHPRWLELGTRRHAALPPLPARERLLASMTADGMPLEVAWRALMGALTTAVAHAVIEISTRGPENKDILTTRMERTRVELDGKPRETLTLTERAVLASRGFDVDAAFSFIMKAFVSGIDLTQVAQRGPDSYRSLA